jgi:hypothetical protein
VELSENSSSQWGCALQGDSGNPTPCLFQSFSWPAHEIISFASQHVCTTTYCAATSSKSMVTTDRDWSLQNHEPKCTSPPHKLVNTVVCDNNGKWTNTSHFSKLFFLLTLFLLSSHLLVGLTLCLLFHWECREEERSTGAFTCS